MSKNYKNSPPRPYFSGALSATRSIVGQHNVESPNFASNQRDKELWQEQSLT